MALALEQCLPPATAAQVSAWVEAAARAVLAERASHVAEIESSSAIDFVLDPNALVSSSPSASSGPINEMPTVALQSNPSHPVPEPASGLSSVSLVASGADASKARSRRGLVLGIGAALVLGGIGLLIGRSTRSRQEASVASATPRSEVFSREASPQRTAPSATTPPAASPSSAASAPVPSSSASSAPKPSPRRPVFRSAAPKPACNPPYTWDAEGRKHYKPECL